MCSVVFSNVLHVPLLNQNLLSVLTLTCEHAFDVQIRFRTIEFIKDLIPHFYASVGADRVALLSGSTVIQPEVASSAQGPSYDLWHCRFGHISLARLKSLVEHNMVSDLSLPSIPAASSLPVCPACMEGKQTHEPFPQSASRRSLPLELVHSDLHGPIPPTVTGYKYWISFTDDASRYWRCWLLRKKSEAFDAFKQYQGITSLLSDSHLPARFWGEALSCFQHTLNQSPTAAVSGKTPAEVFYGRKPTVSHLRVFRCHAFAHIQKDKCSAFQPKSRKCIFLGYPLDYKGWKCWDPVTGEVFISRDVRFVETEMPGAELDLPSPRYEPRSGEQPGSVG